MLYNLLVAERRRAALGTDDEASIEKYRAELAEWAAREADEGQPYEPDALWELVVRQGGKLRNPQCLFIERWSRRIAELDAGKVADDDTLRTLITQREWSLKGARARLANLNRLQDWSAGVGVGRMDFRWVRVPAVPDRPAQRTRCLMLLPDSRTVASS